MISARTLAFGPEDEPWKSKPLIRSRSSLRRGLGQAALPLDVRYYARSGCRLTYLQTDRLLVKRIQLKNAIFNDKPILFCENMN
jgi:hypothetical protein